MAHVHEPGNFNKAFALGALLNGAYVLVEASYGFYAGSLALIADAGHNLSDVLSLLLAWGASLLATSKPTARYTYGFRRATIIASLLSSILLLVAVGGIAWEALQRIAAPLQIDGRTVIFVAGAGMLINAATAMLFASGRKRDLNVKAAFLHMTADAAVSFGVVVGGIAILLTGQTWWDPAISLAIAAVILISTWGLLRDSFKLAVDAVPEAIDPRQVREYLCGLPGVEAVHDLHIWGMSTTETALTAHLTMPSGGADDRFLAQVAEELRAQFQIDHSTVQVEQGDAALACQQTCADDQTTVR